MGIEHNLWVEKIKKWLIKPNFIKLLQGFLISGSLFEFLP